MSRLQDIQWRVDTAVVDKHHMVGELRVGLRVFYPASGTHRTHNFSISAQQLHLLLAGECHVGCVRNLSASLLQAYVSAPLECSYTKFCSISNTAKNALFFPVVLFWILLQKHAFFTQISGENVFLIYHMINGGSAHRYAQS